MLPVQDRSLTGKESTPTDGSPASTLTVDFGDQISTAQDSIATLRTKNTGGPIINTNAPFITQNLDNADHSKKETLTLLELIELQEWRRTIIKLQTSPEQAQLRATMIIEGQQTEGYPIHLAASKKPPVRSSTFWYSDMTTETTNTNLQIIFLYLHLYSSTNISSPGWTFNS